MDLEGIEPLEQVTTWGGCVGCRAQPGEQHDPFCQMYMHQRQQMQDPTAFGPPLKGGWLATPSVGKEVSLPPDDVDSLMARISTILKNDEHPLSDLETIGQLHLDLSQVQDSVNLRAGPFTKAMRLEKLALTALRRVIALQEEA